MYALPVAVLTNDFFIFGLWMRTFASKTDEDLVISTSIALVAVTLILGLVGTGGLLAAWMGSWPGNLAVISPFFSSARAAAELGCARGARDGRVFKYSRIRQLHSRPRFDWIQ